jgi:hypothetical protein
VVMRRGCHCTPVVLSVLSQKAQRLPLQSKDAPLLGPPPATPGIRMMAPPPATPSARMEDAPAWAVNLVDKMTPPASKSTTPGPYGVPAAPAAMWRRCPHCRRRRDTHTHTRARIVSGYAGEAVCFCRVSVGFHARHDPVVLCGFEPTWPH